MNQQFQDLAILRPPAMISRQDGLQQMSNGSACRHSADTPPRSDLTSDGDLDINPETVRATYTISDRRTFVLHRAIAIGADVCILLIVHG